MTEADGGLSLEKALAKTQSDAAQVGNLREMHPSLTAAEQAIAALRQQLANTKDGWDFDEDAYFGDGSFVRELRETAERLSVRIYEQDDRLYCYPSLVRVLPNDRAVQIDKKKEPGIRPTVLVERLRKLQTRKPRFKPEQFLEALYRAYELVSAAETGRRGRELLKSGAVVRLLDIYRLLTVLPGQTSEYAQPEFARDIYLLDQSGVTRTRGGYEVGFPVGTGTRAPASTIRVVTQDGREKLYYGLAFTARA